MAGDIPQFHRGRSGKVTAQNMNAIGRSALHSRHDLETNPTPIGRDTPAGPNLWPIIARIGEPVTEDDAVVGFAWDEVHFADRQFTALSGGRSYDVKEKNYCVPLGVTPSQLATLYLTGAVVRINYMPSATGIVLFFDLPSGPLGVVDFLMIKAVHSGPGGSASPLTPNCSGFASNRRYEVDIVKPDTDFFTSGAFASSAPSFSSQQTTLNQVYAYNLLEYNNGNLGGEQQVNDCNVETQLATIPVGTVVIGKMMAQWEDKETGGEAGDPEGATVFSRAYGFSVVNDSCVRCCVADQEGLYRTTFERAAARSERRIQARSPVSILDEMLR
jgi:hypothetical protein